MGLEVIFEHQEINVILADHSQSDMQVLDLLSCR